MGEEGSHHRPIISGGTMGHGHGVIPGWALTPCIHHTVCSRGIGIVCWPHIAEGVDQWGFSSGGALAPLATQLPVHQAHNSPPHSQV